MYVCGHRVCVVLITNYVYIILVPLERVRRSWQKIVFMASVYTGAFPSLVSIIARTRPAMVPILTAAAKAGRNTPTSPFRPSVLPPPERTPSTVVFRDSLLRELADLFDSRLALLLPPSSTRPVPRKLISVLEHALVQELRISNEAQINDYMKSVLRVAAAMAEAVEETPMTLESEKSSSLSHSPRVIQEIVGLRWVGPGHDDYKTVVSNENKSPAVGRHHFEMLEEITTAAGERGWNVPSLNDSETTQNLKGLVDIFHKVRTCSPYSSESIVT